MDITATLAPKSEQMDACELAQPATFTIVRVTKGASDEQPVQVFFEEFPRPWRPSKSMRRVLAACWTVHTDAWIGRRATLFCDPNVKFGGVEVGGIRISHLSDLDGPKKVPLLITKGKSAMHIVHPLKEDKPRTLSQAQSQRIGALLKQNELADKATVLAVYAEAIGRDVAATKDLTVSEADKVIAALERMGTEPSVAAASPPADADYSLGFGDDAEPGA